MISKELIKSKLHCLDELFEDISYKREQRKLFPDRFPYWGAIAITGELGSGKSLSANALISTIKELYPKVKIIANCDIQYADYIPFEGIETLASCDNDEYGIILYIDEISNIYGNLGSTEKLPPEWLKMLNFLRKKRCLIVGTCPAFSRISKVFRESFDNIIICDTTFFGHMQLNYVFKNNCETLFCKEEDRLGNMELLKVWRFWRSPKAYDRYNTYELVKVIRERS